MENRQFPSMIQEFRSTYWYRTLKYGGMVTKSMDQANSIYAENVNTLWMDAVKLEMKNVMIGFE